jgi:hypothetical protein
VKTRRIGPGYYQVESLSHDVVVQRAYTADSIHDDPRPCGWHLIVNQEWWQTYATKREAVAAWERYLKRVEA